MTEIPLIDLSQPALAQTLIHAACIEWGFFYIKGHGIPADLLERLNREALTFFAKDEATKMQIAMAHGGLAWRGYFPKGAELTSGKKDRKEGLYFGSELAGKDLARYKDYPLHGKNQFPPGQPQFKKDILAYMTRMQHLAASIMELVAMALLGPSNRTYFAERFTKDPMILLRIFGYEPLSAYAADEWGVGEHTDYGFLTILYQDTAGGLEVKHRQSGNWIAAPHHPDTFVVNIGDMMEYWSHGRYLATPHRVRSQSQATRISIPFFFDPGFFVSMEPIDRKLLREGNFGGKRTAPQEVDTYGRYLWHKVSQVFPELAGKYAGKLRFDLPENKR